MRISHDLISRRGRFVTNVNIKTPSISGVVAVEISFAKSEEQLFTATRVILCHIATKPPSKGRRHQLLPIVAPVASLRAAKHNDRVPSEARIAVRLRVFVVYEECRTTFDRWCDSWLQCCSRHSHRNDLCNRLGLERLHVTFLKLARIQPTGDELRWLVVVIGIGQLHLTNCPKVRSHGSVGCWQRQRRNMKQFEQSRPLFVWFVTFEHEARPLFMRGRPCLIEKRGPLLDGRVVEDAGALRDMAQQRPFERLPFAFSRRLVVVLCRLPSSSTGGLTSTSSRTGVRLGLGRLRLGLGGHVLRVEATELGLLIRVTQVRALAILEDGNSVSATAPSSIEVDVPLRLVSKRNDALGVLKDVHVHHLLRLAHIRVAMRRRQPTELWIKTRRQEFFPSKICRDYRAREHPPLLGIIDAWQGPDERLHREDVVTVLLPTTRGPLPATRVSRHVRYLCTQQQKCELVALA